MKKESQRRRLKSKQANAPRLHMRDGLRQADSVHGELNFADAAEEICDEDTSWVPQEKVSPVARSGHALTLGAYFELRTFNKHRETTKKYTPHRDLMYELSMFPKPEVWLMCVGLMQFDLWGKYSTWRDWWGRF